MSIETKIVERKDEIIREYSAFPPVYSVSALAERLARKEITHNEAMRQKGEDFFLRISYLQDSLQDKCQEATALVTDLFNLEANVGKALREKEIEDTLHRALSRVQLSLPKGKPKELTVGILRSMMSEAI